MIELASAVASLLGLAIGSFLNVVIYRVPIGKSVIAPRSACPNCGRTLNWFENIPVLSWVALRGKCRTCKEKISPQYLLVEILTAVIFGILTYWYFSDLGSTNLTWASLLELFAYVTFFSCCIALAAIDFKHYRLPTSIVTFGFFSVSVLLIGASFLDKESSRLIQAGLGLAISALLYGLIHLIRPDGMGRGDVNLSILLGLVMGWAGFGTLLVGVFLAFLLGAIFGLVIILFGRGSRA